MTPAQIAHLTALADEHLRSHGYQQGGFTACTCELCDLARGVLSLLEERARLVAEVTRLNNMVLDAMVAKMTPQPAATTAYEPPTPPETETPR